MLPRACPAAARGCQPCPGSRGPWADQTVLLSSASWQAVPSALRRHLRQPNFLLRGPLWAWIQNKKHQGKKKKKHQGRGSKRTEAGQPCEEQARLVAGCAVGYQSPGSSEQGVGSRRGQRGRLGRRKGAAERDERGKEERGGETDKKGKKKGGP